jgi:hypothetical protein
VIVNIDAKYKSMRTLEDYLYSDFQVKNSDDYRRENSVWQSGEPDGAED